MILPVALITRKGERRARRHVRSVLLTGEWALLLTVFCKHNTKKQVSNDIDYPYCWTDLIDLGSGSAFATWYPGCDTSSRLQILQLTSNPVTTTLSTSSTIASTVQLPPETVVTILPTTVVVTSISILSLPYPTSNSATDSRTSSFTTQSISSPTTSFTADSSTSSLTSQSISSSTTSSTVDSRTNSLTTGVAGISSGSTSSSSPNSSAQAASASASSTTGGVITSSEKSTNTGAIAGGTVGGVAVFAGIAGLVLFLLKKRRSSKPPIAETTEVNSMPHTAFVAPAPQEMHSPESSNRWSGGNSSEPQMSESAAGPRTSYPYYAPGQQTRPFPQQEISQVNYPDTRTFSRHFNIEMPG